MGNPPLEPGTEGPSGVRPLLKSNAFRIGIVVLSAAIIFGAWVFTDRVRAPSDDRGIVLSLSDDPYEEARKTAESGDTTGALTLLERILADDPGHERATALQRRLSSEPGGSGGSGSEEVPPRDEIDYLEPVEDLRSFLPEVIPGWTRGIPVADDTDATVPFDATVAGTITRATFSVHDRESEADARAFVEGTSAVAYASDGGSVRVGVVDAYFGTDGARLATVAFARGRFAFEVVMVVPEADPASAKEQAIVLAEEFDAAR